MLYIHIYYKITKIKKQKQKKKKKENGWGHRYNMHARLVRCGGETNGGARSH